MTISTGSRLAGTCLSAFAFMALSASAHLALAETVSTINGADIDSSVLDFYIESRTQRPAAQASADERSALLKELEDIYLLSTQNSADELKNDPRVQAQIELQTRSLLAQNVASQVIQNMEITDEDIQAEYEQQADMAPQTQYKARHILVESQGEAAAIIDELDGGADFETLAKERSTGPSGPNGGDLGWFSPNQMVAPFSAAVQSMEDGQYSDNPVQTDFGWHVILRESSRQSEPPPLDSVRDTVRQAIQQKRFQAYLEQIRFSAGE
jgi:peptidyl-prolyl cis-trans isomerase C